MTLLYFFHRPTFFFAGLSGSAFDDTDDAREMVLGVKVPYLSVPLVVPLAYSGPSLSAAAAS